MLRFAQGTTGVAVLCLGSSLWAAEIRWTGEEQCRRELEVSEQVETMTGRPLSSVEIADFELRVQALSPERWTLELTTVRRADGTRSTRAIHGATCAEVTDAAAVAIALAVGTIPAEPEPAKANAERETHETASAQPASSDAKPSHAEKAAGTKRSLDWFAGLGAEFDSSATPSPALGGSLHFGVTWLNADARSTQLRFELEGALYAPTPTSSVAGQAGKFQLAYGAPLLCGAKPLGVTTLLMCAGAEFGQLSGEGVGEAVTTAHPSNTFWSAARAELGFGYPRVGSVRVLGRAGVALPLIRREFVLDGPEVVFRAPAVSARVGVGVELSL